jgi:methylphosphotriester-DNA--protein-cysteine methyltransferase
MRKLSALLFAVIALPLSGSSTASVYYGSSKSNIYYLPSCTWAQKIASANPLTFDSKAQAAAKGYRPAKSACRDLKTRNAYFGLH